MISPQETRRLFGPLNRPDKNTNVRHRALLRKALELFSVADLEAIFERPVRLRVVMGSALNASQLGKIQSNFIRNGRLVSQETPVPDAEARRALRAYLDAYDTYFMKRGSTYRIRDEDALAVLQAAEQTWHDWIVRYLARLGRPGRSAWALQPLPGIPSVRLTPRVQHPATPVHRLHAQVTPPTPPSSSPICRSPARRRPRSPAPRHGSSHQHPIDLSNDEGVRPPKRGRFLGVVDTSDDDEVEIERPRKRQKLWRVIDLTL
ncbi:hypothetical protein DFH09DRAFT_1110789 [Mycena vulgaris]|nr:hypothetical protein DFH09DRAFT_1110789 [Mycena vulgaris]